MSKEPKKPVNKKRRQRKPSEAARKQIGQKLDSLIEEEALVDDDLSEDEASEIDTAIKQSAVSEQKKAQKKQMTKFGAIAAVIVLISYGIYGLFIPYKGEQPYAICRTFLELNVQYPSTLRMSETIALGGKVRIWYSHLDGFGQFKIDQIECNFRADDYLPYALEFVTMNRIEVDQAKVDLFNRAALPFLINYELDLTLPWPLPNRIRDLQFDTYLFRRPIF